MSATIFIVLVGVIAFLCGVGHAVPAPWLAANDAARVRFRIGIINASITFFALFDLAVTTLAHQAIPRASVALIGVAIITGLVGILHAIPAVRTPAVRPTGISKRVRIFRTAVAFLRFLEDAVATTGMRYLSTNTITRATVSVCHIAIVALFALLQPPITAYRKENRRKSR